MTQPAPVTPISETWTLRRALDVANGKSEHPHPASLPRLDVKQWAPPLEAATAALRLQGLAGATCPEGEDASAFAARQMDEGHRIMLGIKPLVFLRGSPCPIHPSHVVVAMFAGDGETSVYALALTKSGKPVSSTEDLEAVIVETGADRPRRYRLTHGRYEYTLESMPLAQWIDEVAQELDAVAGIIDDE